jgi:hypothetical protein
LFVAARLASARVLSLLIDCEEAVNHYNAGYKELGKIDKDVLRITDKGIGIEIESIERPALEGRE